MRRLTQIATLCTTLLLGTVGAGADTLYSYTGDYFVSNLGPATTGTYHADDRITGSFTVRDGFVPNYVSAYTGPLAAFTMDAVLAYAFTDGHQKFTKANSNASVFYLDVPAVGLWAMDMQPKGWALYMTRGAGYLQTECCYNWQDVAFKNEQNYGSNHECVFGDCAKNGHHGTWTSARVPEPSSLVLLLSGGGGVGLLIWRSRRARRAGPPHST